MEPTILELPYPPSVNQYWRRRGSQYYISRNGQEFRKMVVSLLAVKRVKPIDGELSVYVDLYPPDKRRRDLDNAMKGLLDALQHGGAYADDGQISELSIKRMPVVAGGKAVVKIERMA